MTIKSVAIIGAGAAGIHHLFQAFLDTMNMMYQGLIEMVQAPQLRQLSPPRNTLRQSESLNGRGAQEGHGSLTLIAFKSKIQDIEKHAIIWSF
jgi:hypothetical protein